MANSTRGTPTKRAPMDSMRRTALVAGVFYRIAFVAVATLFVFGPVLKDPSYILNSGSDTGMRTR